MPELVQAVEESNRPLTVEFAYLKLLPRECSGPRHIIRWARIRTGDESTKGGPALGRPIKAGSMTRM